MASRLPKSVMQIIPKGEIAKMKNFTLVLITMMGLTTVSTLKVLADTSAAPGGNQLGNQLGSQNQSHWYEKAADAIQPAEGSGAKGGTVLALQKGSLLYMVGDSTLHQYQMRAGALKGSAVLKPKASKDILKALQAGDVASMTLIVPVADFKSRESGLDTNAYKALKSAQNPEIKFVLNKETLAKGLMTAIGNLTIAGSTAPVTLSADTTVKDGKVEIKGMQKLKMSDFKVTPPSISLLVTSITCSDQIEIHYDVIFTLVGEAGSEAKK